MARMLGIGEAFPHFSLQACVSLDKGHEFRQIDYTGGDGRWKVMFFWPHDFTFVCPTEIAEFNHALGQFEDRDTDLYGISTDSHFVHLAWRQHHDDLRDLRYPMLADYKKDLSEVLGILHPTEKVPLRATYIIDPLGIVRWVSVNDMKVGRNVKEVVRILDALQTDELCPCNWQPGEAVLQPA
jgi:peroxiredoxin (alkyl hydroperoxide reductase subunit C)